MFKNPYSPVFGGKPNVFFGRKELLSRFSLALSDPSSEDRALFITGTRGSGKTALIERLSSMASSRGWTTIDLGPDHTSESLLHKLAGYTEKTSTINPQVSVSVLGTGGGVSGRSTSKTTRPDKADLSSLFLNVCTHQRHGLVVTIDEVQKVPEEEVSAICNAFQLASRKGHDVILVVAGLPYAHREVIRYEGCTYMRRAHHVELGLLSRDEAYLALDSGRRENQGLSISQENMERLVDASYGHPYMLQLLGYYLISVVNEESPSSTHEITQDEVQETISRAVLAYESRSLQPLSTELTPTERSYLVAMSQSLGEDRTARTADVARRMGKELTGLGYVRESLVNKGIVMPAGYGLLMFNIPYLADYVLNDVGEDANLRRLQEWGV